MPLIDLKITTGSCLALWNTSEPEEVLLKIVKLDHDEFAIFNSFKSKQRRLEYLSVRNILQNVLNIKFKLLYNEYGKPYFESNYIFLSISHSGKMVGVFTGKSNYIGLDIEVISPKILRISDKFINEEEKKLLNAENVINVNVLIWCTKEVITKIYGKKDLEFKSDIDIMPFNVEEKGEIRARVNLTHFNHLIPLNYFRYNEYYIVYGTI